MNKSKVEKVAEKIFYKIFAKENLDYSESLAVLETVKMWIVSEYTMDLIKDQESQVDESYEEEEIEENSDDDEEESEETESRNTVEIK